MTPAPRLDALACTAAVLGVDTAYLLKFARSVARGVSNDYGFRKGGQEEQELEAFAYLQVFKCAKRFDPARTPAGGSQLGQFRGWAHYFLKGVCHREAKRLKGGGMWKDKMATIPTVEQLPWRRSDCGHEELDVEDHRGTVDELPPPPPIRDILEELDTRERAVIRMRFGLEGESPKNHAAIAALLCVTRDAVAAIEEQALEKLRGRWAEPSNGGLPEWAPPRRRGVREENPSFDDTVRTVESC